VECGWRNISGKAQRALQCAQLHSCVAKPPCAEGIPRPPWLWNKPCTQVRDLILIDLICSDCSYRNTHEVIRMLHRWIAPLLLFGLICSDCCYRFMHEVIKVLHKWIVPLLQTHSDQCLLLVHQGCIQMQKQTKQCLNACHAIPPSLLPESRRGKDHMLHFTSVDDLVRLHQLLSGHEVKDRQNQLVATALPDPPFTRRCD
jgi:hypothetical protein